MAVLLPVAGCGLVPDLNGPDGLAIQKFVVSPKEVTTGSTATLSWEVAGAESIQIDNGIGVVPAKGSVDLRADRNTTYTLTARSGTSQATASVQVLVGPGAAASPSPAPSPTPSPTPSPSPSPSPGPSPTPSPNGSSGCGVSVESAQGCTVRVHRLQTMTGSECIEITRVTLGQACPVSTGSTRSLTFDVTADTKLGDLRWRKSSDSGDDLNPTDGQLVKHGTTTANVSQLVRDPGLTIEIISQGTPVLSFTVKSR